jgi:hypothetical protein
MSTEMACCSIRQIKVEHLCLKEKEIKASNARYACFMGSLESKKHMWLPEPLVVVARTERGGNDVVLGSIQRVV